MKNLFIASIAAATALSGVAFAEPASRTVSYADLDLARPAGAEIFLRRLEAAASSVCGGKPSSLDLSGSIAHRACVRTTIDKAVDELDAPMVTAIHLNGGRVVDIARN